MTVLSVKNLTKTFISDFSFFKERKMYTAVNDISFHINKGEILGFLGHNGAGKTTTIQMLLGTLIPDKGSISYFNLDFYKNVNKISKRISYASGYDRMPTRLTVFENLDIVGRIYGIPKDIRIQRIKNLLQSFGIFDKYDKQVSGLSAGQSTCVILAKAFLSNPDLVLLDEPTASLDPEIAYKVRQFILKQNKENGTSILITSHNMKEVTELCNRVIILNKGSIIANDLPEVLVQSISKVKIILNFDVYFSFDLLVAYLNSMQLKYIIEKNYIIIEIEENNIALFLFHLAEKKIIYLNISIEKPTLEDYFLNFLNKEAVV